MKLTAKVFDVYSAEEVAHEAKCAARRVHLLIAAGVIATLDDATIPHVQRSVALQTNVAGESS